MLLALLVFFRVANVNVMVAAQNLATIFVLHYFFLNHTYYPYVMYTKSNSSITHSPWYLMTPLKQVLYSLPAFFHCLFVPPFHLCEN